MSIWSAIVISLAATCCYQVGTVLQKVAADRMPRIELGHPQGAVVGAFFRSPIWLAGIGIPLPFVLGFAAGVLIGLGAVYSKGSSSPSRRASRRSRGR